MNFLPPFPCHPEEAGAGEIWNWKIVSNGCSCYRSAANIPKIPIFLVVGCICAHMHICMYTSVQYTSSGLFLHSFMSSLQNSYFCQHIHWGKDIPMQPCYQLLKFQHPQTFDFHTRTSLAVQRTQEGHNFDIKFVYLFVLERHCVAIWFNNGDCGCFSFNSIVDFHFWYVSLFLFIISFSNLLYPWSSFPNCGKRFLNIIFS